MAGRLRSIPSSIADCGQMSLTLKTKGARLRREKARTARPMGRGGDCTKMTSVGPRLGSAVRLENTNENQLMIRLKKPEFGVAYTHLRRTRTPSIRSSSAK